MTGSTRIVVLALGIAALPGASGVTAQQYVGIRGRVVVDATHEPVPSARIVLLDESLTEIAHRTADEAGVFRFEQVPPGSYSLQAELDGMQSALASATIDDSDADIELVFPAAVVRLAFSCMPAATPASRTVLGTVYDPTTGVVLPATRVRVNIGDESRETLTDERGQYRFCHLPAGEIAVFSGELLGRRADLPVRLPGNAIERVDIALEMNALSFSYDIPARRPLPEGSPSSLVFHVRDAADGHPLGGAAIELQPDPRRLGTGRDGILRFDRLAAGRYDLVVEHIGYGRRTIPVDVRADEEARIDLAVPPLPVRLDPIAVKSSALGSELRDRASPTRVAFVAGEELAFAQERAARVADVLRSYFPGLQVKEGQYSTFDNPQPEQIVCLESGRRLERLRTPEGVEAPFCDMIVVVIDGIRIFQPGHYLRGLAVDMFESMELLNPLDAGIRYGVDASNSGALLLWTRGRGPHMSGGRGRN